MKQPNQFSKNLLLAIITLVLMLFAVELGYRAYRVARWNISFSSPVNTSLDPIFGWGGKHLFGNPQTNKMKIFIVGDSYTYGNRISENNMYYRQIEKKLDAELFIYGASSYGTLQEYLAIDKYLNLINPDLILLQVCHNDFINNSWELQSASFINSGCFMKRPYLINDNIELHYQKVFGKEWIFLSKHSFLANKLYSGMMKAAVMLSQKGILRDVERDIEEKTTPCGAFKNSADTTRKLMKKILGRAGAIPVIAFSVDHNEPYFRAFREIFAETNIEFIDSVPARIRQKQENGIKLRLENDGHWNEAGHLVCGQTLAEELLQRGYGKKNRK